MLNISGTDLDILGCNITSTTQPTDNALTVFSKINSIFSLYGFQHMQFYPGIFQNQCICGMSQVQTKKLFFQVTYWTFVCAVYQTWHIKSTLYQHLIKNQNKTQHTKKSHSITIGSKRYIIYMTVWIKKKNKTSYI